jgi:enterochelin esterase-like enzyme
VVVLAVIAAGLLAALLWWWPKLAGNGLPRLLLRAVALCALQLSVLSLIFVVVNRSAEFYSSWSDLLGTDTGGGAIIASHYHFAQTAPPVTVIGSSAVSVPGRRKLAAGRLQTVRLHGQLSGLTAPAYIYLPAGYSTASGRLPVVVVLSDQVGSRTGPYSANRLSAAAAVQIAAGRLRPLILVMLPPRIGQQDQGCLNVPGGAQAGLFFSQDLPQALGSTYRIGARPGQWGLLGDSSGGYCALQLAMTSSVTYSAAVVPAASYQGPPGTGYFIGSPELRAQDNLSWLLQHQPMQPVSVLFAGPGPAQPFMSLARSPMHVASASLATGQWPLAPLLDWVGRTLGRPRSTAGG